METPCVIASPGEFKGNRHNKCQNQNLCAIQLNNTPQALVKEHKAPAAGNHTGWDLLLASCRAVFRIGVSAPVLLWGLACLLAPCLLEQLSSRQPKTHDARHPAKEDLAHAQATASCLAQQRLLVSYLLPLPPSYTNTKQLATSN